MFQLTLNYNTKITYPSLEKSPIAQIIKESELPLSILLDILLQIKTPQDIFALMFVNKAFLEIFGHQQLWENISRAHLPNTFFKSTHFRSMPIVKKAQKGLHLLYDYKSIAGLWSARNKRLFLAAKSSDLAQLRADNLSFQDLKEDLGEISKLPRVMDYYRNIFVNFQKEHFINLIYIISAISDQSIRDYVFKEIIFPHFSDTLNMYIKKIACFESFLYKDDVYRLLCYAASLNQIDFIKELSTKQLIIRDLLNTFIISVDRTSALQRAIISGHLEMVKLLLSLGASFESYNYELAKPLHLAALFGRSEIVKHLEGTASNKKALLIAAENGHTDVVRVLTAITDVEIDAIDPCSDMTALCYAAQYGHLEIFKILLDAGAYYTLSVNNNSPLALAVENKNYHIISELLPYKDKFDQDEISSLLVYAHEKNDNRMLALLSEFKPTIYETPESLVRFKI